MNEAAETSGRLKYPAARKGPSSSSSPMAPMVANRDVSVGIVIQPIPQTIDPINPCFQFAGGMCPTPQIVASAGPYPLINVRPGLQISRSSRVTASPTNTKVEGHGTSQGCKVCSIDGVRNDQLTWSLHIVPASAFVRSNSDGMHRVAPAASVVKISYILTSNAYEEK